MVGEQSKDEGGRGADEMAREAGTPPHHETQGEAAFEKPVRSSSLRSRVQFDVKTRRLFDLLAWMAERYIVADRSERRAIAAYAQTLMVAMPLDKHERGAMYDAFASMRRIAAVASAEVDDE